MIKTLKSNGTIDALICINVSRPYQHKIPPQIRSVPSILNTNGQVLTGMFAQNFITTVLPQLTDSDPHVSVGVNRGSKPVPNDDGMNPQKPPFMPTTATGSNSNSGSGRRRPPPSVSPTAKVSIDAIAKQQREHQMAGGLLSANFGTEFSTFSYLPGSNDLKETFSDFEYLTSTNQSNRQVQQSSKSRNIDAKLEAMQKARSQDMKLAGRRG